MSGRDVHPETLLATEPVLPASAGKGRVEGLTGAVTGSIIGELLAVTDAGATALVRWLDDTGERHAVPARTIVDLQAGDIGGDVLLIFERGEVSAPVVLGVVRRQPEPAEVDLWVDGERLVVTARHQLVLRCGLASLALRQDGRIELHGTTIVSQASGSNRIRGGSVELN